MRTGKFKRTVDTSESDCDFVEEFEKQVDMLTGMIEEAFHENKVYLLSPVMREMMLEKGRSVKARLAALKGRLVADNLGDDFKL